MSSHSIRPDTPIATTCILADHCRPRAARRASGPLARWLCVGLLVGATPSLGCAKNVRVEDVGDTTGVPMHKRPVSTERLNKVLERRRGVLFHRDKGIYQPLARPYFAFENNRGPETIVQELDGDDGPEYQVFLGGYRDPVTRSADVEVEYVAMGYPTTAKNVDGDAFRIGGVQPLVFVMRSGDEVLYVSTKYSVSVAANGAGGMSHQVSSYPDYYRYRFKALAEKVGGPVEVALDFQTGWVWVIPVLDGAPDPSRIAIAIFHSANDNNAPRIRGFEITP